MKKFITAIMAVALLITAAIFIPVWATIDEVMPLSAQPKTVTITQYENRYQADVIVQLPDNAKEGYAKTLEVDFKVEGEIKSTDKVEFSFDRDIMNNEAITVKEYRTEFVNLGDVNDYGYYLVSVFLSGTENLFAQPTFKLGKLTFDVPTEEEPYLLVSALDYQLLKEEGLEQVDLADDGSNLAVPVQSYDIDKRLQDTIEYANEKIIKYIEEEKKCDTIQGTKLYSRLKEALAKAEKLESGSPSDKDAALIALQEVLNEFSRISELLVAVTDAENLKVAEGEGAYQPLEDLLKEVVEFLNGESIVEGRSDELAQYLECEIEILPLRRFLAETDPSLKEDVSYTKANLAAYNAAAEKAKALLETAVSVSTDLEELKANVNEIMGELERIVLVNVKPLEDKIKSIEELLASDEVNKYTKESVEALRKMLEEAKSFLNGYAVDTLVTPDDVNRMAQALENASKASEDPTSGLVARADITELQSKLEEAGTYKESQYTAESYKVLKDAMAEAAKLIEERVSDQDLVDKTVEKLQKAIEGLVEVKPEPSKPDPSESDPSVPGSEGVDRNDLTAALEKAGKKDKAQYTAESYKALEDAIKAAEAVLNNKEATQEEINAAVDALNKALNNLKKADTGSSESSESSEPSSSEQPSSEQPSSEPSSSEQSSAESSKEESSEEESSEESKQTVAPAGSSETPESELPEVEVTAPAPGANTGDRFNAVSILVLLISIAIVAGVLIYRKKATKK